MPEFWYFCQIFLCKKRMLSVSPNPHVGKFRLKKIVFYDLSFLQKQKSAQISNTKYTKISNIFDIFCSNFFQKTYKKCVTNSSHEYCSTLIFFCLLKHTKRCKTTQNTQKILSCVDQIFVKKMHTNGVINHSLEILWKNCQLQTVDYKYYVQYRYVFCILSFGESVWEKFLFGRRSSWWYFFNKKSWEIKTCQIFSNFVVCFVFMVGDAVHFWTKEF